MFEYKAKIEDEFHLLNAARHAHQLLGSTVWWRGHAVAAWRLVPHVHRRSGGWHYEQNVANRFMAKARTRNRDCPPIADRASWLFFMQHYGLPTRLLDWSESILVAAYFAVSSHEDMAADLWALTPFGLNECQSGMYALFGAVDPNPRRLISQAFAEKQEDIEQVLALYADEVDLRMMVQQSAFTIHGSSKPFEEFDHANQFLLRFLIPAEAKPVLKLVLARLGIRQSSMFPDLEHLAGDIASLEFVDRPTEQIPNPSGETEIP